MFPVVLVLLLSPLSATARVDDYTYTTNGGAVTITGYTGPGGDVIIPDTINGLPVTSIESNSFYGSASLTSVVIPDVVTIIGVKAFGFCTNLTKIAVDEANSQYSSVDGVMFNKSQSTLLQFPAGRAGPYAIPNNVASIGDGAFIGCTRLTSVVIPDSVATIGDEAFYGCAGMTGVEMGHSVTVVGMRAFCGDTNLRSVEIPDSVTTIGYGAFSYCSGLISARIGNSVTTIESHAFRYCIKLSSVVIPDSVTTLGHWAFGYCWSLPSIVIPGSVTNIGSSAFSDCTSLRAIHVSPLNSAYRSVEGVLFNKSQSRLIQYPAGKTGSYVIPNSVTDVGDWAFYGCAGLTSVVIPDHVTRIGGYSFSYCTSLMRVEIPDTVTSIGICAFSFCGSLPEIIIPDTVARIGSYAFNRCPSLRRVYFEGNAPSHGVKMFEGADNVTVYYLPGNTGWGAMYGERPTSVWVPDVIATHRVFGGSGDPFGFIISWANNRVVVVEATEDLKTPIWSPVSTNTIVGGSCSFSDPDWTNHPTRFYRLRSR